MLKSILSENRRTLSLAVPIVAGHIGQMLMGWVDTIMVGRIGVVPLGACAFANTLISVPLVFGFGLLSAVSVRASHAHGAGLPEDAAAGVRGGFVIAFFLGLGMALLIHAGLPFVPLLGQPEEVNAAVDTYLILTGWSLVPVYLTCVSKNFCEAFARPWIPFWILLSAVLLNATLNWVFIYGNLGSPAMGLAGAGLATLIARIAAMAAVFAYPSLSRRLRAGWPRPLFAPGMASAARSILTLGLPAGMLHLCEVSGFAFGSLMMGWIGVTALAAHQVAITCAATTFMVPLGLSQAACVRVGHARGLRRTDRLRPIIFGALGLSVSIMSVFAVAFVLGGSRIAVWFVPEPHVVHLAASLLVLAGVFQIFDGIQVVSSGILRGFEETRMPMVIGVVSYWMVALPVSWTAAFKFGYGAPGIWAGFVTGLAVAAGALLWRVLRKCRLSA